MKNQVITVTLNDYQRLMGFIELASMRSKTPAIIDKLVTNLKVAKLMPQKAISKKVVTMNSRVRLVDVRNKRNVEVAITYPQEAEPRERRVSVFSEIGLALLGRRENDIVAWHTPTGIGEFQIDKVIYQPEAAGDYAL